MKKKLINCYLLLMLGLPSFIIGQTYRQASLPDAMTFQDGRRVKSIADFEQRKAEIKQLWCEYFIGHFPSKAPALLSSRLLSNHIGVDGINKRRILLTFDTRRKKSFELEVWVPKIPGPYPLLLTAPRFYQLPWAEEAYKRGYMVCLYPGLDVHHKEDLYAGYQNYWATFRDEYPEVNWSSSLAIQAWLASRALDYLLSPASGYRVDTTAVGIIGHSRYGKQAIYAGAFDKRIKAVVARSSGTPTACSYRYASRQTFMESVSDEDCPEVWVLPALSDYLGRENELPIEGNSLLASIAPRHLLLHTAYNDGSEPTFGVEQSYVNAQKAFALYGKPENISLVYRQGGHDPITAAHVQLNIDYFDWAFGRDHTLRTHFSEEKLLHQFSWPHWKARQPGSSLMQPPAANTRENIAWMLGSPGHYQVKDSAYHLKTESELGVPNSTRDRWNPGGKLKRVAFGFAHGMSGNAYFNPAIKYYKGTVIWLHPWNYSHGSSEGYGVQGTTLYWRLAKEGYIVVAYDQFGFGDQLLSAVGFYEQNPGWSLLGRAVSDVSGVIDFLVDGKGLAESPIPKTDPSKIYICGFSYGGMVGLYAAALDPRISGVASFSGFTPMRADNDAQPTGGIRQYFERHAILPKLGLFNGKEQQIPYDYADVIKLIAPRKCLVYAPLHDRFSNPEALNKCLSEVKTAGGDSSGLDVQTPDDICRFQKKQQNVFLSWMKKINKNK